MALTLSGASIKLFINNKVYSSVQSITLNINYNEKPIIGIDSPWPQEIAPGKIDVSGSVSGIRTKNSGGLQGSNMRPLFKDIAAGPYISIRIQDRETSEDIAFLPECKITDESHSVSAKGVYRLNFNFIAKMPLMALDRAD
jgi:hypothetical protein